MNFALTYLILEWVLRFVAIVVVPRRRMPTAGTAWLLLIFLLPVPGWIIFLLLGDYKLPKKRRDIQERINNRIDEQIAAIKSNNKHSAAIIDPVIPDKYQSLEDLTQEFGRMPSLAANSLDIIDDYNAAFACMVTDINKAQSSVYIEYYTMTLDKATKQFFEALVAAKKRGVDVRILFDSWGSRKYPGRKPMLALLKQADISYRAILPLRLPGKSYVRPDLRNHRKIVIIDGAVAYTGSQNLIDRHYNRKDSISYDELVVRIMGPVVQELTSVFATDWISEGGNPNFGHINRSLASHYAGAGAVMQVLPSGPGYPEENNLKVFTHLLHIARTEITIVNPYFVPPEPLLGAIVSAATRGVKVRMINSKAIDQWMIGYAQRSYYATLLEAGVEILLYNKPKLLHSKFIVVDDEFVVVGSSNMDVRSFELNSELSLLCFNEQIAKRMSRVAHSYAANSTSLTLERWQSRPVYRRVLENIARLTAALQ